MFMIGCEEGVFPHSRSLEEGDVEEERRLCYVGITRATQRLWLTYARAAQAVRRREPELPSRFLGELPDELVERRGATADRLGRVAGWARGSAIGGAGAPRAAARAARLRHRRRRRPRQLRRGRRDRGRAGRR